MENMNPANVPIPEEILIDAAKSLSVNFHSIESEPDDTKKIKLLKDILTTTLDTASTTSISSSHRTAACNVLCGTIEKCLASSTTCLAFHACSDVLFDDLHSLFLDRYHSAKEKSMKQVLSTIVKLVVRASALNSNASLWVTRSLERIFEVLFRSHERSKAKPALHALQQYISKHVLTSSRIIGAFQQWNGHLGSLLNQSPDSIPFQQFLGGILDWTPFGDVAPSVGLFLASFLRPQSIEASVSEAIEQQERTPPWVKPLMNALLNHLDHIQAFQTYIFPSLFRHRSRDYWRFLQLLHMELHLGLSEQTAGADRQEDTQLNVSIERAVLFSSLQVGVDCGLVVDLDNNLPAIEIRDETIFISKAIFIQLLDHVSPEIRLAALKLLLASPRSTRPYELTTLKALTRNLPHFFAEADPNIRGEINSLVKTLVDRLRLISATLAKAIVAHQEQNVKPRPCSSVEAVFEIHKGFIRDFAKFLTTEIHPAASYQRHISALNSLIIILKSGLDRAVDNKNLSRRAKLDAPWSFEIDIVSPALNRALADALLNPFEDVRQTALEVLKLTNTKLHMSKASISGLSGNSILSRAQCLMAQSGRVDHSDCVACIYGLLAHTVISPSVFHSTDISFSQLVEVLFAMIENSTETARTQLSTAVAKYPIHGYLTALRYVLESAFKDYGRDAPCYDELLGLFDRALASLRNIWECMKPLLCNDAPEGFMPLNIGIEPNLTSKNVLSFAWRALKESSLLLRTLISQPIIDVYAKTRQAKTGCLMLSGDLCFTQLAELRHRGAFSTVSQTFAAICRQCVATGSHDAEKLVNEWYKRALLLIEQKGCVITRRSAGIPALMVGILAAEAPRPRLADAVADLRNIAAQPQSQSVSQDAELPQVHALNSLKAIFNNSVLGEQCECHIVDVMSVAYNCLGSNTWSIRNCGIMVFRGLIDRLLGSNESLDDTSRSPSSHVARLSYERYPGLVELAFTAFRMQNAASGTSIGSSQVQVNSNTPLEAIFMVLDLFRRAPPPQPYLSDMRHLIFQASKGPHWHIRDLAARTFAASFSSNKILEALSGLTETSYCDNNELHGRILCMKYGVVSLLSKSSGAFETATPPYTSPSQSQHPVSMGALNRFTSQIFTNSHIFLDESMCDPIKGTYLQTVNALGHLILQNTMFDFGNLMFIANSSAFSSVTHKINSLLRQNAFVEREAQVFRCFTFLILAASQNVSGSGMPVLLRAGDSDISVFVLRTVNTSIQNVDHEVRQMFFESLARSLSSISDGQVIHAAEEMLIDAMDGLPAIRLQLYDSIATYFANLDLKERVFSNQFQNMTEHNIRTWGFSLGIKLQRNRASTAKLVREARMWIAAVRYCLDASNDVALRRAAIRSMRAMAPAYREWRKLPRILQLRCLLTAYKSLNDDDDDIRDHAAEVSSSLMQSNLLIPRQLRTAIPLISCENLCAYLIKHYSKCPWLMKYAVLQLLQHHPEESTNSKSAVDLLKDFEMEERILFVVEKQNLYIDEVREAKVWSKVLQSMDPAVGSLGLLNVLANWAWEGLDALINASRRCEDGPLGWTSNPDTFVLGIRIIRAAEAMVMWRTKSGKIKAKTSVLVTKLQTLYGIGEATHVHEMWMSTIESILQKVVKQSLTTTILWLNQLPVDVC